MKGRETERGRVRKTKTEKGADNLMHRVRQVHTYIQRERQRERDREMLKHNKG